MEPEGAQGTPPALIVPHFTLALRHTHTPGTTSHGRGVNFPPSAQFQVILPSRFSLPSLIGPHSCPFQFPIPVPPPGITTSVPSSVPHPHSPLCASPRRGRGPQAGASVLRLFCTPQTFCIFLILLQHEILKVISVPAVCVLLFWLYWPEEGDKEGENWEEGHPLPAVPVALLRDKDIQQGEARTFHKAPC